MVGSSGAQTEGRDDLHGLGLELLVLGTAGGIPGAGVTAFCWLGVFHVSVLWAVPFIAVGFVVAATLGIVLGSGLVKEVWVGPLHAFLLTTPLIAFLNFLVLLTASSGK
jgi:hypothetical protein